MNVETLDLTPAKRWLVQRIHQTYFGTMHNLVVRDGEPVIDPPPKIKQSYKLGSKRVKRIVAPPEFVLKDQHVDLLEFMESKRNVTIGKLSIQDGLPFLVEWEED
jgi:hypothetical protein